MHIQVARPLRRPVFIAFLLASLCTVPALAQDASQPAATDPNPWRNISFGATLEAYYQYDWNRPPDRVIPLRAYDPRANTFSIQQAAFVLDAAPEVDAGRRYGLRVDFQWGQATEILQGSPVNEPRPDVYRNLWQVYGSYIFPVGPKGLRTDFGKFASNLGYETNYAKDNQAFSRAYLFNFLPYYHTGLRLTYPVNDTVTVLYMLTNGIQQTEDFNDFKSNQFGVVLTPTSQVSWTVNYYFGQEQPDGGEPGGPDGFFRVFETNASYAPVEGLLFGIDFTHTTNELTADSESLALQGLGAYARYQVNTPIAFGVRYEHLDDEGLFGGIDQTLQEITLTAEYKLADGFLVRGEFRRDWSNVPYFPGPGGASDLKDHQNTLLIGAVWVIGNKKGVW